MDQRGNPIASRRLGGEVAFLATTLIVIDVTLAALFWDWGADDDILARLVKKTLFVGIFGPGIANGLISGGPQLGAGAAVGSGIAAGGVTAAASTGTGLAGGAAIKGVVAGARGGAAMTGGTAAAYSLCSAGKSGAAGVAGGLIWQSARGTIQPWMVEVDRLGEARTVAPATADYQPTDPQIAFHLASFIENARSIAADPIVVRQNWLRAYEFTTDRGALALNDYARANDPFAQVGEVQVSVDVSSVIRASPDSFRVAWTERRYRDGSLASTERWTAILTISVQPPRTAERLRQNPLGIYVHAISWSRELQE